MTKKFTLLQLFSVLDGRLATDISDVYEVLNHVTDDDLFTHHLPIAIKYLRLKNPKWFQDGQATIKKIAEEMKVDMSDFPSLISGIEKHSTVYDIPQLKDEFDTSDFIEFMVDNSLLKGKKVIT